MSCWAVIFGLKDLFVPSNLLEAEGRWFSGNLAQKMDHLLTSKVNGISLGKSSPMIESVVAIKDELDEHDFSEDCHSAHLNGREDCLPRSYWIPIGWNRISQLVQTMQIDAGWVSQPIDFPDEEDDATVTDLAAPYWERPVGPTWWCHVAADHPHINASLNNAPWLHPAISVALKDESKLLVMNEAPSV